MDQEDDYLSIVQACDYLGGITRQTLRLKTKQLHIRAYKQAISRTVYYRKTDLDRLKAFHPLPDQHNPE